MKAKDIGVLLVTLFLAAPGRSAETRSTLAFPRLGAHLIGGQSTYTDEAKLRKIGRYSDLTIFGFFPRWESIYGTKIQWVLDRVRAENPRALIGAYHNVSEVSLAKGNQPLVDALNAGKTPDNGGGATDWWAHTPGGERTSNWRGAFNTNITDFTTPNQNGKRYREVYADFRMAAIHSRGDFDIWYTDIFRPTWRTSKVDYNRDGVADSARDPVVAKWKRDGMVAFVEYVRRTYHPNGLFMGNGTGWARHGHYLKPPVPEYPEYTRLLDGGLQEDAIGPRHAHTGTGKNGERVNKWGSFDLSLFQYRNQLRCHKGELVQYQPLVTNGNWKTLRYGLGITLLDNGYYSPNVHPTRQHSHSDIPVLDEYTRGLPWTGPASTKWLGHPAAGPLGAPPTKPYGNGVYVREFVHGLVVVDPHVTGRRGKAPTERRGAHTISLPPGSWSKFEGGQDPEHNDGRPTGGSLTIDAGDACLLVRQR